MYTGLNLYIVVLHCKFLFFFIYFVCFVLLYDHDMFHILLSCDSLRDLWNEYMYVCMYVCMESMPSPCQLLADLSLWRPHVESRCNICGNCLMQVTWARDRFFSEHFSAPHQLSFYPASAGVVYSHTKGLGCSPVVQ